MDVVNSGIRLGQYDEPALNQQLAQFTLHPPSDPLQRVTGLAALRTAVGQNWLEMGTKINPTSNNGDGRLLAGFNMDLAGFVVENGTRRMLGQAQSFLDDARTDLMQAQSYLQGQGRRDTDPEMAGIRDSLAYVNERLGRIYGQHDITGAFNELKNQFSRNFPDMSDYTTRLAQQVVSLPPANRYFVAKMRRDVCLLELAFASFKASRGDGEGARSLYQDAMTHLQVAEANHPNAADLPAIRQLAASIRQQVPGAIAGQYGSSIANPFGVSYQAQPGTFGLQNPGYPTPAPGFQSPPPAGGQQSYWSTNGSGGTRR
jgi:hypothetical protein